MNNFDKDTKQQNIAKAVGNGGAVVLTDETSRLVDDTFSGLQVLDGTCTIVSATGLSRNPNSDNLANVTYTGPGQYIFPFKNVTFTTVGTTLAYLE